MDDLIKRSDVIGLLEDMLLFGEYDIIASSFSKADEEKAYRAINDIPAVNRWIPCSERLPEDGQRVLIWSKSKRFFDVIFRANALMPSFDAKIFGKVYTWYCEDIIKWMPLPEAPKEDENE